MSTLLGGVALLLVVVGLLLLWGGRALRRRSGLPSGDIAFSDMGLREEVETPLVSRKHGLVGRPDYLIRRAEGRQQTVVPVEVKSRRRPHPDHPGHVLQLGAYCLLVEEAYGVTPAYGVLRYADETVTVPFTAELRSAVLRTADEIRAARTAVDVRRSHESPGRCRNCGYRSGCGQEL